MADGTRIEWTDATWNVINGCSVVSPGCTNCYAMRLAGTRLRHHPSRQDLTKDSKAGPVWTGGVSLFEPWLDQPLRWKRPRRIFVCAHGDLFYEAVPDEWIRQVFAIMETAGWHIFQVLTKRPARAREWLIRNYGHGGALPNVWLGVSVEDQKRADERIHELRMAPAAVRWISAEPLLGPINLTRLDATQTLASDCLRGIRVMPDRDREPIDGDKPLAPIDWVVVGGESGPGARPMHPTWARALRHQCQAAGVPFLFKQWGDWSPEPPKNRPGFGEWLDEDLESGLARRVGDAVMWRIGKKAAGRTLDGRTHDAYPETEQ